MKAKKSQRLSAEKPSRVRKNRKSTPPAGSMRKKKALGWEKAAGRGTAKAREGSRGGGNVQINRWQAETPYYQGAGGGNSRQKKEAKKKKKRTSVNPAKRGQKWARWSPGKAGTKENQKFWRPGHKKSFGGTEERHPKKKINTAGKTENPGSGRCSGEPRAERGTPQSSRKNYAHLGSACTSGE